MEVVECGQNFTSRVCLQRNRNQVAVLFAGCKAGLIARIVRLGKCASSRAAGIRAFLLATCSPELSY